MRTPHKCTFPFELLDDDTLAHLLELLGLDALRLRQVNRYLSTVTLPGGVALALKVLKCRPNYRVDHHKPRLPAPACAMIKWDRTMLDLGLAHRIEWASLVQIVDAAPINTVIDAFLLIPKYTRAKKRQTGCPELRGEIHFLQDCVRKSTNRNRSTSPVTTTGATKRKAEWLPSLVDTEHMWHGLSNEAQREYIPPASPQKKAKLEGSEHTLHVRAALHKCIEARLWDVISGYDVTKRGGNDPVKVSMSNERVLNTVKRMFAGDVHVHNGPSSFFYTKYGWLGFTPYLLAAERQNLPLVKHLEETCSRSITADSRSQAGNNAYGLSKAYLKTMRSTPADLEASEMLRHLAELGLSRRAKRDEYVAWAR